MGLLDFQEEVDDFAFANFDSSFSPASTPSETSSATSAKTEYFPTAATSTSPFAGASMESVSTSASSSSTSSTPRKTRKSRKSSAPPRRKRAQSFDLFGEDDELQSAEPTIHFCDICLKDCQLPEHR